MRTPVEVLAETKKRMVAKRDEYRLKSEEYGNAGCHQEAVQSKIYANGMAEAIAILIDVQLGH